MRACLMLGIAALAFVPTLPLQAQAQAQAAEGDRLARGERLLTEHCGNCHAIGRAGPSTHAEAVPFRELGRRYPIESLEEALGEGLMSGHPDMPEFSFGPTDVGAIIAYLSAIQQP